MSTTPTLLDAALELAGRGLPGFPVNRVKEPLVRWREAATRDERDLRRWFGPGGRFAGANLAVALPPEIVVLDEDEPTSVGAWLEGNGFTLDSTTTVRTPRGGRHFYYLADTTYQNAVKPLGSAVGFDIKTAGGYVLVPPSRTAAGAYTWLVDLDAMAPAPSWLAPTLHEVGKLGKQKRSRAEWLALVQSKVPVTKRAETLISVAGYIMAQVRNLDVAQELALAWALQRLDDPPDRPLDRLRVATIVAQVRQAEERRRAKGVARA